jgi:hypothetical protein
MLSFDPTLTIPESVEDRQPEAFWAIPQPWQPPDYFLGMKRLRLMLSIAGDERGEALVVHRENQSCFAIHITHGYSSFPGDSDPHPRSIKLIAHGEDRLSFVVKGEYGSRVPLSDAAKGNRGRSRFWSRFRHGVEEESEDLIEM